MAITNERIVGYDVGGVKIGQWYYDWQTIELVVDEDRSNAKGSDSNKKATVSTATGMTLTLKGLLGTNNNGSTLPLVNDPVDMTDATIAVDGDALMPDILAYTDYVVIGPKTMSLQDGAGEFTIIVQSGGKNPNPA